MTKTTNDTPAPTDAAEAAKEPKYLGSDHEIEGDEQRAACYSAWTLFRDYWEHHSDHIPGEFIANIRDFRAGFLNGWHERGERDAGCGWKWNERLMCFDTGCLRDYEPEPYDADHYPPEPQYKFCPNCGGRIKYQQPAASREMEGEHDAK